MLLGLDDDDEDHGKNGDERQRIADYPASGPASQFLKKIGPAQIPGRLTVSLLSLNSYDVMRIDARNLLVEMIFFSTSGAGDRSDCKGEYPALRHGFRVKPPF